MTSSPTKSAGTSADNNERGKAHMASQTLAEGRSFRDPEIQRCPFAFYKELRDAAPVYWDPEIMCYVVSRYRTNQEILRDTATFSNIGIVEPPMPSPATPIATDIRNTTYPSVPMLVTNDPPQHTEFRRISNGIMTARLMRAMEPMIDETAVRRVDAMVAKGGGDFISEYAVPLPIEVISALLGMPAEMAVKCKEWSDALIEPLSGMVSEEREIECAHQFVERQQYFAAEIERIRSVGGPPEHLITGIALARTADGELFSMAEALALIEQYMIAGTETTTNALGMGVLLMIQRPDLAEAIRADPAKVTVFVEEVLRLFGPVQGEFRVVARDTRVDGVDIPAGSKIMLRLGAANRDDRVYEMADDVDLDRRIPRSHLAFGSGVHTCQGTPLARLELASTFGVFAERVGTVRVDGDAGGVVYAESILHIGLAKMPLVMTPADAAHVSQSP